MNLKKLLENRATAWASMQEIQSRSADGLSAEDRGQWDKLEAELSSLSEDIVRAERAEHLAAVDYSKVIDGRSAPTEDDAPVDAAGNSAQEYRAAFDLWARFGNGDLSSAQRTLLRSARVDLSPMEKRAEGVGTGAAGGYTVPPLFRDKLIETLKYYSGMRQVSDSITTDTGATLPWMTNNDTANLGSILGENTQVVDQDLTFGTAALNVFTYTSNQTRVSLQLLQDSALDLEQFLPRKLGERIGRIQNQHFTTGTGVSQPQGMFVGGTAVVAAAGNTVGFNYGSLIDVMTAIDPAYLGGGNLRWMFSQAALGGIRKLMDLQGHPLWQPSIQVGQPDSLLGYGIVLNNDVPIPAVSAKSGAFGDFRAGYIVRDVTGVQSMRLDERYADFLQVGFLAFQRAGGIVQDTNAFRILQNSAT